MKVDIYIETSSQFQGKVERKCGYVLSTLLRGREETRKHFGTVSGTYHQAVLLTITDALEHIDLINEGNEKFSRIPCIYKTSSELEQDAGQEDDIVRQIMIIQANCYRDKSDWEKMTETLKMEGLVKELREKTPMEGKTRDILKDLIGTSGGQLGRYHAISTRRICPTTKESIRFWTRPNGKTDWCAIMQKTSLIQPVAILSATQ